MKQLLPILIGVGMLIPTTGCIVQNRRDRHQHVSRRDCPPAHHWDDGRCVHNGKGRGNGKGKGRGPR
jgi:hypothetical protein